MDQMGMTGNMDQIGMTGIIGTITTDILFEADIAEGNSSLD